MTKEARGKDSLFNIHLEKLESYKMDQVNHSLTPCAKINPKWIKYLNIRPK